MDSLSARMQAFKDRMMAMAKGKHSGYDTLDGGPGLQAPLVSQHSDGETPRPLGEDRMPGTAAGTYAGPVPVSALDEAQALAIASTFGSSVPKPAQELMEHTHLAKEAASILWEMVALGEEGPALDEMVSRAETLQCQLRGLIGDVADVDELTMAEAFQAFDMLSRCLSERSDGSATTAVASAEPAASGAAAPVQEGERPLIEL